MKIKRLKIIAASMDIEEDQFVATLCEVGGGLVAISGYFLKKAVSLQEG